MYFHSRAQGPVFTNKKFQDEDALNPLHQPDPHFRSRALCANRATWINGQPKVSDMQKFANMYKSKLFALFASAPIHADVQAYWDTPYTGREMES